MAQPAELHRPFRRAGGRVPVHGARAGARGRRGERGRRAADLSPDIPSRQLTLRLFALLLALAAGFAAGCKSAGPRPVQIGGRELIAEGLASWYGPGFQGRRTASGEVFDGRELTAAHRTLPFNSLIEVVNLDTAQSVVVRINDRGPFVRNRVIDLSHAAADALGLIGPGVARVRLYLVGEAAPAAGEPCTVQVGAFQEAERAAALARDLAPRFPGVAVRTDGTWHRVQISRFTDRGAAEAVRQKLAELGFAALIVPWSEAPPATP